MCPVLIHSFVIAITVLALTCRANVTKRCTGLLLEGYELSASCLDDNGVPVNSTLDLGTCIGYDPSQFKMLCGHGFQASCSGCHLYGHAIYCACDDGEVSLFTGVGINGCVADKYGQMVCIPPIYD